ncbi:uncharacterized protein LOC106137975 [Amyelois transitella]|uniref:uncharacterized protein LOC106137975 n=1 Tax=Amyelois transitella TaxID=680683 RepID=UPI00299077A2|nr:uncharacterized protein LOC106137975 [Amyelois transitella]
MVKCSGLVLLTALTFVKGHVAYRNTPNKLQPVHGLYVKPSVDGTTGDLYVAASEDSGVKSQWLTDQPVGFLPATAPAHQALPIGYNPNAITDDPINTQKRAVVNAPLQYAYAYPVQGNTDGNAVVPYSYGIPTPNSAQTNTESLTPRNPDAALAAGVPQYHPLQYFYPQMMSAYAELLNAFKENASVAASAVGTNDESNTATTSQSPSMWPYAYPVQYVMVDPSMWGQAAAVAATPSTTTSATVIDNE